MNKLLGVVGLLISSVSFAANADPLAELAALGEQMNAPAPEGGGSIRAKRDVDAARLERLRDPENSEGKVEEVKRGNFPQVALKIRVLKPAKNGESKDLTVNTVVVAVPNYKVDAGKINVADNVNNAAAFYLQSGDRITFKLNKQANNVWQMTLIERK